MKKNLNNLYFLKNKKNDIIDEIKEIRMNQNELRDYKSICITGMPKSKPVSTGIDSKVCKIIDVYENQINECLLQLEKVQFKLSIMKRLINQLNGNEHEIICKRYIEKKSWGSIEKELHYSKSTVFRIHNSAIHNLVIFWDKLHNDTK